MNLNANKARLSAATQQLLVEWNQTRERWNDIKCQEFEQKYIDKLRASVGAATEVIEQLEKLVNKIRNDCE